MSILSTTRADPHCRHKDNWNTELDDLLLCVRHVLYMSTVGRLVHVCHQYNSVDCFLAIVAGLDLCSLTLHSAVCICTFLCPLDPPLCVYNALARPL